MGVKRQDRWTLIYAKQWDFFREINYLVINFFYLVYRFLMICEHASIESSRKWWFWYIWIQKPMKYLNSFDLKIPVQQYLVSIWNAVTIFYIFSWTLWTINFSWNILLSMVLFLIYCLQRYMGSYFLYLLVFWLWSKWFMNGLGLFGNWF